jgi:hypothetical protein
MGPGRLFANVVDVLAIPYPKDERDLDRDRKLDRW